MQVITSTAGRYEIQELEFGQVYKWHPETVGIECVCGEKLSLTRAMPTCKKCGADHTAVIREWVAVRRREEDARPWRHSGKDTALPY